MPSLISLQSFVLIAPLDAILEGNKWTSGRRRERRPLFQQPDLLRVSVTAFCTGALESQSHCLEGYKREEICTGVTWRKRGKRSPLKQGILKQILKPVCLAR